jgi:hypothetical protein
VQIAVHVPIFLPASFMRVIHFPGSCDDLRVVIGLVADDARATQDPLVHCAASAPRRAGPDTASK